MHVWCVHYILVLQLFTQVTTYFKQGKKKLYKHDLFTLESENLSQGNVYLDISKK